MKKKSEFKPAWWLPGPHLQTAWPLLSQIFRPRSVKVKRERVELPDGDFLDIDWTLTGEGPLVLILHGLGGSIESPYARGILSVLQKAKIRAALMHFRGCSGETNRLSRSYHSGETGDLAYICDVLRRRFPGVPIIAIGYSLGGNVLLKWLGETQGDNPLNAAIAVSVPFELERAANHVNSGIRRLYQWWMLRQLRSEMRMKFTMMKGPVDPRQIESFKSFWEFDHNVTAPLHGFSGVHDYYQSCSSRHYLRTIAIPTLILQAVDDPLFPKDIIPDDSELADLVELELSESGGHVGFVGGRFPGFAKYWLEERILSYIKDVDCLEIFQKHSSKK